MKFFLEGSYIENLTHLYFSGPDLLLSQDPQTRSDQSYDKDVQLPHQKGLFGGKYRSHEKQFHACWTQKSTYVYIRSLGRQLFMLMQRKVMHKYLSQIYVYRVYFEDGHIYHYLPGILVVWLTLEPFMH